MVSVRRSHQTSSLNFEQWLKTLELIDVKKEAIKVLWDKHGREIRLYSFFE